MRRRAQRNGRSFHTRVVDVLRRLPTYHRLTMAALRYDWTPALEDNRGNVMLAATTEHRRLHAKAAAQLVGLRRRSSACAGGRRPALEADGKAAAILQILARGSKR